MVHLPIHQPRPVGSKRGTRGLVGNSCLTGIYFGGSKIEKNMIPEDFFFPVFSGGIFHRNAVLEGVTGIPVFGRHHRIFSQEFLWDRNSCIYSGFLQSAPDSCSHQTLSGSGQLTNTPPTSSPPASSPHRSALQSTPVLPSMLFIQCNTMPL